MDVVIISACAEIVLSILGAGTVRTAIEHIHIRFVARIVQRREAWESIDFFGE